MSSSAVQKEAWKVAGAVAFYFTVSLSITFLNKILLDQFRFPLFTTWFQLIVALFGVAVAGFIGDIIPSLKFVPSLRLKWDLIVQILPLSFIYIGMICLTNVSMAHVSLTFYQILRALVIPVNATISFLMLNIPTSKKAQICCFAVCVGFILGSLGEIFFTWIGFVSGTISSLFVALYSIYVKKKLPLVNGDTYILMQYNTVISIVLLLPPLLLLEPLSLTLSHPLISSTRFWMLMTCAGAIGLLINLAYFLQIKLCSPLTSHISGNAKSTLQSLLSVLFFDSKMSPLGIFGLLLTLVGSIAYSQIKYQEMKNNAAKETKKQEEKKK